MKPMHIGFLIAVGALAGALVMKMTHDSPEAPKEQAVVTAPQQAAQPEQPAPAAEPAPTPAPEAAPPTKKSRRETPTKEARSESRPAPAPAPQSQTPPPQATMPAPSPVPAAQQPAAAPAPVAQPVHKEPEPPPPPRKVTLPAGTELAVRLIDGLSTERNQAGDAFTGTLAEPLAAEGFVIAERGARVEGRVVEADRAGRVRGVSSLAIELTKLRTSDGQSVAIQTDSFTKQGEQDRKRDAAKIGAAAGIGAAIGAIAGGGKGAAIGAAAGGAAGTGGVMATRGKDAELASETRLRFRLREPVTITERRK